MIGQGIRTLGAIAALIGGCGMSVCSFARDIPEPERPRQFFVNPDTESVLRWNLKGKAAASDYAYEITDYIGKVVSRGTLRSATGTLELNLNLPRGFYEIRMPEWKRAYGLVVQEAHQGAADPFFGIDAALSLKKSDALFRHRDDLVYLLHRSGIISVRERILWHRVNPRRDQYDFETAWKLTSLRNEYNRNGIKVLETFHDAPRWTGVTERSPYPTDLQAAFDSAKGTLAGWRKQISRLEIWNEPELRFGGNLPADQYMNLVKVFRAAEGAERSLPLVGGIFVSDPETPFHEYAVRNGLFRELDAVSIHTHRYHADQVHHYLAGYRRWLRACRREAFPLWMTECGRAWTGGGERPDPVQGIACSSDTVMKVIESKVFGLAQHYIFLYSFLPMGNRNYSMIDGESTPQRSMGAFVQAVRVLSGKTYLGDLRGGGGWVKARVFGDSAGTVAVVYTGKPDGRERKIELPFVPSRVEGADGRKLVAAGRTLHAVDGLVYIWLPSERVATLIDRNTEACQLAKPTPTSAVGPKPESLPVIIQAELSGNLAAASPWGYHIRAEDAESCRVKILFNNLSAQTVTLKVTATTDNSAPTALGTLILNPRQTVAKEWTFNLAPWRGRYRPVPLIIAATEAQGGRRTELALGMIVENGLRETLKRFKRVQRVELGGPQSWSPNAHTRCTAEIRSEKGVWSLDMRFKTTIPNRWCFPRLKLPEAIRRANFEAVVIRARCAGPAAPALLLYRNASAYCSSPNAVASDGRWHNMVLALKDFRGIDDQGGMAGDEGGDSVGPKNVSGQGVRMEGFVSLAIGMLSLAERNRMEVSDLYLVGK